MSGFSPELIDYLEGKISFEEFERLREERKAIEREAIGDGVTEDEAEITAVEDRDGPPRASHSRTKQKPNDLGTSLV
ncbi:general transcription factor 3C polypeptide 3-like [Rhincodon typus]|uniref:general transcription factor 3C polypeptide 3-like n=1 Tax=Rhincodon typus TaxID=259920 RepID=UPI00202F3993|nr:general transcription factor 3C polypeptide 3-like [Rhincodon typus]